MQLGWAEKVFDRILTALGLLVALGVAFCVLSMTFDWFLKSAGFRGIRWLREVIEYGLFAAVFLGAPWALRQGAQIRVDLILSLLPRRGERILEQFLNVMGIAVCGALAWLAGELTLQLYADQSIVRKTITVERWILQAIIVVSMVLCVIEFIFRLLRRPAPAGNDGVGGI